MPRSNQSGSKNSWRARLARPFRKSARSKPVGRQRELESSTSSQAASTETIPQNTTDNEDPDSNSLAQKLFEAHSRDGYFLLSTLCQVCRDTLDDWKDYKSRTFWGSYTELVASAQNGCALCAQVVQMRGLDECERQITRKVEGPPCLVRPIHPEYEPSFHLRYEFTQARQRLQINQLEPPEFDTYLTALIPYREQRWLPLVNSVCGRC